MGEWLKENNFSNLTFFGQDWGGLIGLRMVAQDPDRFIKVSMGNTGLPYNPDVPQEVIDQVKEFRASDLKLTPMKMQKQIIQMDGKNLSKDSSTAFHPALKFMYWQKFCWDTTNLPVGFVCSTMMEKRSKLSMLMHHTFISLDIERFYPFTSDLIKAYEAPFPDSSYKMGPRAMPSQVPTIPDQSLEAQKKAREFFKTSTKPFLAVFAGDDPVTNGIEKDVLKMAPNAKSAPHIGGGHFYQWTRPKKLSDILISFMKEQT